MNTKLRIKMGAVEVEYEGSDDFLKKELPGLLKAVLALHAKADEADGSETAHILGPGSKSLGALEKVSPSTAAVKLKVSSGAELGLAAAISLFSEGKESFTRSELLSAMQQAKSHYKSSYSANLSNSLTTLIKSGAFLHQGGNNYALNANKREELEATLAA